MLPMFSTRRVVAFSCVLTSMVSFGFAQQPPAETVTLFEAIRQKKVVVTSSGAGIQAVSGSVQRTLGTGPLRVTIPIGTLFAAGSTVQNMVTVAESIVDLTATEASDFFVSVACANMRRSIPSSMDTFTVKPAPEQEALSIVLPVLVEAGASYPVKQAAVWILTDNATYADLGILVSRSVLSAFGGSRMITQPEVVQAMIAIEKAGLDLTRRRIWSDRISACQGIASSAAADVRAWCDRVPTADMIGRCGPLDAKHRTTTDSKTHAVPVPMPGKAVIYFIRGDAMRGALFQAKLAANERWIGVLPRGRHYSFAEIDPGVVRLCATGSNFSPLSDGLAVLRAEAGRNYYFEARLITGFNRGGVMIAALEEARGAAAIAASRLVTFREKQ